MVVFKGWTQPSWRSFPNSLILWFKGKTQNSSKLQRGKRDGQLCWWGRPNNVQRHRHTTSQAQRQITILLHGFYQFAFINLFSVSQPHKHAVQAACSTFWEADDKRSSEDSKNFSLEKQEFKIMLIIYFEVERFQLSQVLWIKEQIFMTTSFFYRSRNFFWEKNKTEEAYFFPLLETPILIIVTYKT